MIFAASGDGVTAGLIISATLTVLATVATYIKGRQGDRIVESANKADAAARATETAFQANQALIDDLRESTGQWRVDAIECRKECENLKQAYSAAMDRLSHLETENLHLQAHVEAQDAIIVDLRAQIATLLEGPS